MANTNPCTIIELCEQFDLDLYELFICCVFCRKVLEDIEKWSCRNREINVVWKKEYPYAVCCKCLEVQAILDLLRYFERSGSAKTVEEDTGKPLGDLRVRCYGCYKPLTATEKLFHVEDQRPFTKVCNQWRGICTNCQYLPPRLLYYFFTIAGRTVRSPLPGLTWGFDPPPANLSESESSSWTTTTTSSDTSSQTSSSVTSGRRDDNLSDAESNENDDENPEVLI
ncbi:E6 [Tursiops truncatus papillomavirus 1]|uniref:Protein E6 n=1 Tax=Tursiops truncatus papillomavirus 1 TaxID=936059 RepID=B4XYE0_9PAPI|nr:E6 [Tursiops truncatus papillomavirus 1]ABY73444.1 E6 [Tursiops truncatus papillomavirus 1]